MYGATEATSRMSYLPYEFMLKKGSIGKGLDNTSLYIVDQKKLKINKQTKSVMVKFLCKGKNILAMLII